MAVSVNIHMFVIFENAWTKPELAWFYQDMQKTKHNTEKQNISDPNYKDHDSVRWRCEKGTDARNRLQEKILKLLPDHEINFAAYVEQYKPNRLHCDSHGGPFGATCIIPLLDYEANTDQTLVFDYLSKDGETTESILKKLLKETEQSIPKFKHTQQYKLDHCIYNSIIDATKLLGVFPYRQGDMAVFDKRLLHCSNNWNLTDPTRKHKDFIIIHTLKKQN